MDEGFEKDFDDLSIGVDKDEPSKRESTLSKEELERNLKRNRAEEEKREDNAFEMAKALARSMEDTENPFFHQYQFLLIQIMLFMDIGTLRKLCLTSKTIRAACDQKFWKIILYGDFPMRRMDSITNELSLSEDDTLDQLRKDQSSSMQLVNRYYVLMNQWVESISLFPSSMGYNLYAVLMTGSDKEYSLDWWENTDTAKIDLIDSRVAKVNLGGFKSLKDNQLDAYKAFEENTFPSKLLTRVSIIDPFEKKYMPLPHIVPRVKIPSTRMQTLRFVDMDGKKDVIRAVVFAISFGLAQKSTIIDKSKEAFLVYDSGEIDFSLSDSMRKGDSFVFSIPSLVTTHVGFPRMKALLNPRDPTAIFKQKAFEEVYLMDIECEPDFSDIKKNFELRSKLFKATGGTTSTNFTNHILFKLGESIIPNNDDEMFIRLTNDAGSHCQIYNGKRKEPLCAHIHELSEFVHWVTKEKKTNDYLCPTCKDLKNI